MARKTISGENNYRLPSQIISPSDVKHLSRELEYIEDYITQNTIRQKGSTPKMLRTSRLLDIFAEDNKLNLLVPEDRNRAKDFLAKLPDSAPIVHISFASDPSSNFMDRIITWFRANIHPQLLLRIGLEPTIVAGCILRTPNKMFDMSLSQHLRSQNDTLIHLLETEAASGAKNER